MFWCISKRLQCTKVCLVVVLLTRLLRPTDLNRTEREVFFTSEGSITNGEVAKSTRFHREYASIYEKQTTAEDVTLVLPFTDTRDATNATVQQQHIVHQASIHSFNAEQTTTSAIGRGAKNVYTINAEECKRYDSSGYKVLRNIRDMQGTIYLMNFKGNSTFRPQDVLDNSDIKCSWRILVPERYSMKIVVEDMSDFSCTEVSVYIGENWMKTRAGCRARPSMTSLRQCFYGNSKGNLVYTISNDVCVRVMPKKQGQSGVPWAILHFEATRVSGRHILPIEYTSSYSGYIASYDGEPRPYASEMSATRDLIPPKDHVVMVSFPLLELGVYPVKPSDWAAKDTVTLTELPNGTSVRLPYKFETQVFPPQVYNSSLRVHFLTTVGGTNLGFRLLFSFHRVSESPLKLNSGLFNCSVPYYVSFKHHLECNLEPECQGGEDESRCLYSHPPCNGSVGYKDKCFSLYEWHDTLTWREAKNACTERGGNLASLKTPGEREAVSQIFTYGRRRFLYYIGARLPETFIAPKMYRRAWQWIDQTIVYDMNFTFYLEWRRSDLELCAFCDPQQVEPRRCVSFPCDTRRIPRYYNIKYFLCEFYTQQPVVHRPVKLSVLKNPESKRMVVCGRGHVTHDFLYCEADSQCRTSMKDTSPTSCSVPGISVLPKFACRHRKEWIHYSLVCDFREDCKDGSDESFCRHESYCPDMTCHNSQCISFTQWCDGMQHCVDDSDETRRCQKTAARGSQGYRFLWETTRTPPPVVIDFDGRGNFTTRALRPLESCPETHFQCPGEYVYCLPVYVRCNDMYDCPGHEDEVGCEEFNCVGFYRCRGSSICIHLDHICDGVIHCRKQDDEWMCSRNATCPAGCHCQGLAFSCKNPFSADIYPGLRYLDASRSGMMPQNLTTHLYLVHLVLAFNNISDLREMPFLNLQYLDLSNNQIESVNFDVFFYLENLHSLDLTGNPLTSLSSSQFSLGHQHLQTLSLSQAELHKFDSKVLSAFPRISTLNMSLSKLHTVGVNGFRYLPNLMILDLKGSLVETFPKDVFYGLHLLQYIHTDNYKLCCRETLPKHFNESQCMAPVDELSSCEDLLRSDVYRATLWVFAVLSLTGNTGCLVFKLFVQKSRSRSGFNVFVTNLGVADLLMGIYLVMIGVADSVYRGSYLWNDVDWKESKACKLAGFLSLLSSEVSGLIICLITLDRFITLRFPFTTFRFVRASATIVSFIIWALGLFLAVVPLLPTTSHWNFYSQTGICLPLPVTREYFEGRGYSFGVMVVLNFVLFVFVAVGQISIYWSVHTNTMTSETTRKSQDLTIARRLISVAVSDFLCWFPIGLLGMLANRGTPVPGEVSVVMAIFVLPLNSALNPFLYTFNMLSERRRKVEEAQILKWLEAGVQCDNPTKSLAARLNDTVTCVGPVTRNEAPLTSVEAVPSSAPDISIESALQYLESRLDSGSLTYTDIMTYLR